MLLVRDATFGHLASDENELVEDRWPISLEAEGSVLFGVDLLAHEGGGLLEGAKVVPGVDEPFRDLAAVKTVCFE